jgi:glycosyltransferase involved in cell wall biosynthesis
VSIWSLPTHKGSPIENPSKLKFTLFIPTKNEIDAIKVIMPQIRPEWVDEIICVDGHSTDGTPDWLKANGYRVIHQQTDGLIGAYWECMDVAIGDYIVAFSPDGNSQVDAIPRLIEKAKEGYDIVVASRYAPGAHSDDDDWITGFGNWMFTTMANVLYGAHVTDLLVMYRAYRKSLPYDLQLSRSRHPMMEIELMLRGIKNRLRMADIPADEPARIGGVRKMRIFYNGWFVLWVIMKELFVHRRMPAAKPVAPSVTPAPVAVKESTR